MSDCVVRLTSGFRARTCTVWGLRARIQQAHVRGAASRPRRGARPSTRI